MSTQRHSSPCSSKRATFLFLCVPLLGLGSGGCVALAGAGMGFVVSQQIIPSEIHTAQVTKDVADVWAAAQTVMGALSANPPTINSFPRVAAGEVDGSDVQVTVEAYDLGLTIVRVEAQRYMVNDGEAAGRVLSAILEELSR